MLLILAATSLAVMLEREVERAAQRTVSFAVEPSPTDLLLDRSYDNWSNEQFLVIWIESAGKAEPILPPGMSRLPDPGQAVVSPELARQASIHPDLAARYPNRSVLGSEGISSGDEMFAYVRMPENRTLAGGQTAMRVQGFGLPTGTGRSSPLVIEPPEANVASVLAGVLGLLILPGLIVLAVGLASASGIRDRRSEILRSIGAPGRTLVMLAIFETLVLAVPSLVAVTVLWSVIAPRLEQVPLVGHGVVRGDLGLPWWIVTAELGTGIVTIGFVTVLVTAVRRRRGISGPRPTPQRAAITPLRLAPLSLAFVAFMLGEIFEGDLAGTVNLIGIVAAIGGVPLVLPGVLREVGGVLGRVESVLVSIVGLGLQWNPVRAARPFAGYAALIVIALAGSGYLAAVRDVEATPIQTDGPQVITVYRWLDPHAIDTNRLADELGTGLVAPFGEDERAREHVIVVGATCRQLAPYYFGTECDPEAPYKLPTETARLLAENSFGIPEMEIQLVPQEEVAGSGSALVVDDAPLKILEERVRVATMRTLPGPFVGSALSRVMEQSPLVPWLVGGIVIAAIVLMVGCLVSLVDRLLATRNHHRQLLNLGLVLRQLTALEAWLFAIPYGAVATVSFLAGLVICAKLIGVFSVVQMPWHEIGVILSFVCIIGVLGTASAALFGARSVRETPE